MGHRRPLPVVLGSLLAGLAFPALADYQLNFPPPKTGLAQQIYDLNVMVMWICVGIFVVVFGAMFWAIWKHRKSVGHKAEQFHEQKSAAQGASAHLPGVVLRKVELINFTLLVHLAEGGP